MSQSFEQNAKVLLGDVVEHRNAVAIAFIAIVALGLLLGWVWPKRYESSATILVNDKNIIQPLMQGAAYPTDVMDRAKLAQELIQSRHLLGGVLNLAGWIHGKASPVEREEMMDTIRRHTTVTTIGTNLIRISYKDTDPQRAYRTTKAMADRFIADTQGTKVKESESAFNFINEQVKQYQAKLDQADRRLRAFRAGGFQAITSAELAGPQRLEALRQRLDQTRSDLDEAKARKTALEQQIQSEMAKSPAIERERDHQQKLAQLQQRLDNLRLQFRDTFPDIVRLKQQIADMKKVIAADERNRHGQATAFLDAGAQSQFNQQLQAQLSATDTDIQTLTARLAETKKELTREAQANDSLNTGETLAELTRNYEVTQGILSDLLKRREAARVSMDLDKQKQGLSFQIHDAASVPIEPAAPQFYHFAIGGLVLGILLPLMFLYGKSQFDARVRDEQVLSDKMNMPVVAVVPHLSTPGETAATSRGLQWLGILVSSVIFIVISIVWSGNHV